MAQRWKQVASIQLGEGGWGELKRQFYFILKVKRSKPKLTKAYCNPRHERHLHVDDFTVRVNEREPARPPERGSIFYFLFFAEMVRRWCTLEGGFLTYYESARSPTEVGRLAVADVVSLAVSNVETVTVAGYERAHPRR